ncbi:4Fe-4S binding protein [Actomonas aquatica]|uniref:4Fe-4S binding protein n=1 Tax=Actomonas aquatica TaxID=2866162 RepID=A0ABZ1CB80_9BACT|nr:4Fe-4S binding protein [Opitutus sp. WL0086]WRQ88758.1 4Fe-4S binding protein [Opitutus sp. WL0086]
MLGSGIIKGLAVTAKNFFGTYTKPEECMTTVSYPEEQAPIGEHYRSFPFLVCDDEEKPFDTMRCVSCTICEKECPPQCIYIVKSKDKKPDHVGKPQFYPVVFDIDTSVCMSCGICAEVCPFESIKMDKDFEIAATNRFEGLMLHRDTLLKPNSHYQKIRPTDAAVSDANLAQQKEAAAKKAAAAEAKKAAAAKAAAEAKKAETAEAPRADADKSSSSDA